MVNSRAKCLAISQVLRAKSYNSCLVFIFYKKFQAHKYVCFRAKLGAKTRAKLSSLLHISKTADQVDFKPIIILVLALRVRKKRQTSVLVPTPPLSLLIFLSNNLQFILLSTNLQKKINEDGKGHRGRHVHMRRVHQQAFCS